MHQKERISEGELRIESLLKYLEITKSPKKVFLSEDASGIVPKIVYDSHNNELIGLVLPMNQNGMPTSHSFKAQSAERIKTQMSLPTSSLLYIVVAQPVKSNVPPFIVQIFGTNNKFTSNDVLKRWSFTEKQFKK